MALRRGGKAAEEEAANSRISFGRATFFGLKNPGDSATFRLLDPPEDWIYVKQHNFVPTKGAPDDADKKVKDDWPKNMGAVCRRDEAFQNDDGTWQFPDCWICDNVKGKGDRPVRPQLRLWARMVIREEVLGTQDMVDAGQIPASKVDKLVGFRDEIVEEEEVDKDGKATGKKISHPKIVVANMAIDNFFGALQGFEDVYADEGGLLNRDITVTRHGTGTDTEYKHVPRTPTPDHDLADPATKAEYEVYAAQAHLSVEQLEELITERASDDYYARFFDTRVAIPKSAKKDDGGSGGGAPAAQQQKPPEDPATQEQLAAMRARVRGSQQNPSDAGNGAKEGTATAVNFT